MGFTLALSRLWIYEQCRRELRQEVKIDLDNIPKYDLKIIGVLNDDSSKLGRRHFAFIHLLDLLELPQGVDGFFKKGEKSINKPQLVEIQDISEEFGGYEYWSKLCIQAFFGDRLSFECAIRPKPKFLLRKRREFILIVGYIGSGKTEACTLLANELGYKLVPCSKILQRELGFKSADVVNRQQMQELGLNFVNQPNGHERLARAIRKFIKKNPADRYVLDGLRYPKTLRLLRGLLNRPISVIYIESTVDNLYRYFYARENISQHDFNAFLDIVYHPVEREIERFRPIANIVIYNHGSKDAYLQKLREFFREELTDGQPMG